MSLETKNQIEEAAKRIIDNDKISARKEICKICSYVKENDIGENRKLVKERWLESSRL